MGTTALQRVVKHQMHFALVDDVLESEAVNAS